MVFVTLVYEGLIFLQNMMSREKFRQESDSEMGGTLLRLREDSSRTKQNTRSLLFMVLEAPKE
ncbi:hypothetical protein TSUD_103670 [Trifolium subterraneum]|uniref:Uncharacterized protein n=1 Tax=Trifolium subterraneum TaxID=3900 RepID=A0A2Z6N6S9_TRISU|nr:hypothetical protein TSUD_103670 [Trifolium subterraneum]